jgi:hypothetical protein
MRSIYIPVSVGVQKVKRKKKKISVTKEHVLKYHKITEV